MLASEAIEEKMNDIVQNEQTPETIANLKNGINQGWMCFSEGKSLLKEGKHEDAVEKFTECLELLVPHFGQLNKELGPVYVAYGKALYQVGLSKQDSLLNTGAVPENVVEGLAAGANPNKKTRLIDLDGVLFEDFEDDEDQSGPEAHDEAPGDGEEEDADVIDNSRDESENEEDEAEQEEEPQDDMQLAWEVLDLARVIYTDSASSDESSKMALANVHADLGDVAMETEAFGRAAEDFWKAIEIKKTTIGGERELASLYFRFAVALEYDNRAPEAVSPLKEALGLLKKRLIQLDTAEHDDKGKGKVAIEDTELINDEATEIGELIKDVESKLQDLQSQVATGKESITAQLKNSLHSAAVGAAQDLSGLVRKRKPDQA